MKYIVCDIDGTISKVGDRLKYLQQDPPDWDKFYEACFEDEPIYPIIDLINLYLISNFNSGNQYNVVFCTGRRESCRGKTLKWLGRFLFSFGSHDNPISIFMRPDNDHRHDTEIKPELLATAGITPENTAFIIEDRNSMVKKWRELGFVCIQPFEGDF
jgi:hypothetical protein